MFKRNKVPQRKEFTFGIDQIEEDIGNIQNDAEQVMKLYACLDGKVPKQPKRFADVQEYLEDTDTLEESTKRLKDLVVKLKEVQNEIISQKNEVIESCSVDDSTKNK